MKLALITPELADRPSTGYLTRLCQLQIVLERVAQGHLVTWDLSRGAPANQAGILQRNSEAAPTPTTASAATVLRDAAALGLHIWPWFTVQVLGAQRVRILAWIDRECPTHAVIFHPFATELVPELRQRGIQVFIESQNVESDLARQLVSLTPTGTQRLAMTLRWRMIERWEKRFFPFANEVWVPSEIDAERQRKVCSGRVRVRCVPNGLDVAQYRIRQEDGTHDIVLPAHFGHRPNAVGAAIIRDQVLPAVQRRIPDARLVLVGRDPLGLAQALQRDSDVMVTGEVADTHPYLYRAGVVIVPILQGGGTRYKILEALALGLPVVSTSLGAEGLDVHDGEHLLIRDIDGFADAIVSLLVAPDRGRILGRHGRQMVEKKYSWEVVEDIVQAALSQLPETTVRASRTKLGKARSEKNVGPRVIGKR